MATKSKPQSPTPIIPPTATPGARAAAPPSVLAAWLFPAYLLLVFAGYAALLAPGAMPAGQEMGSVRALFTAVNAATLTGFPQTTTIEKYLPLGQAAIFALIVCGSLFTLVISGAAMSRILHLNYSDRAIVQAALAAETAAVLIGAFFLLFDSDKTIFQAVFLAASAFGNCGLVIGAHPSSASWLTHLVILPLVLCGGFGLTVLIELYRLARRATPNLSAHARTVIGMAAWVYLIFTPLLALLQCWHGQRLPGVLSTAAAATIASRTAGMGLADFAQLGRPAIWVVMALMTLGAASGGTGGGVKTTTLAALLSGTRRALAGQPVNRTFGIAATWTASYLLLIFVVMILLLHQLPQTPEYRVLFIATSAAGNVGLSAEALNPDHATAFILCAAMLIGRFAPMMVLWWMADSTTGADLAVG